MMENAYSISSEIFPQKCKDDRIETIISRRSVVLEETILDSTSKLNSIEVEAPLNDHFSSSDIIPKQIIVEKMDEFIQEGQFESLSIVSVDSLHEPEDFGAQNRNITIVPDVFNSSVGETHLITNQDDDIRDAKSACNIFEDNHTIEEVTQEPHPVKSTPLSESEEEFINTRTLIKPEKRIKENSHHLEVNSTSVKPYETQAASSILNNRKPKFSRSYRERQQIRIDKDDPRCRLHFVKFMKKDGKTIKIWECGICGKEFIHQYTLMRHLPTHTDERNFKCKHCGKAFRQMSTLAQHKATHSEFRPYVCDICQKTFSRVSTLTSHKKIHTDSKIHVCQTCGKGFHQKGNLKNHFFTHTNERPYKCDICGRGFNQSSNLQCHKLKTHLQRGCLPQVINNKYKCLTCSESFSRRAQLRHHEEYVHNMKNMLSSRNTLQSSFMPSKSSLFRKKRMGNIRIIQIPSKDESSKMFDDGSRVLGAPNKTGIFIDPINTKAMHKRLSQGLTPFALLKPAKSSPVVVKVQLCDGTKHMLVPASASELKVAGKFSVTNQMDGNRTVQIKVPVVATIHQRVDESGEVHMDVEPPSDEEGTEPLPNEKEIDAPHQHNPPFDAGEEEEDAILPTLVPPDPEDDADSTIVQHLIIDSASVKGMKDSLLSEEGEVEELTTIPLGLAPSDHIEYMIPAEGNAQLIQVSPSQHASVDLLASAVNLSASPIKGTVTREGVRRPPGCRVQQSSIVTMLATYNTHWDCGDVDVDSNVHYLRPTENHGEYEVIQSDEGGTLFTNARGVLQQLKPFLDENEPVTVDQSYLTTLMSVLQTAGYELQTDEDTSSPQIILNSVNEAIIVDDQHFQMVIDDQDDLTAVDVDSMQIEGVDSTALSFAVQHPQ